MKKNGSGNDPDSTSEKGSIIAFPSKRVRDKKLKQKKPSSSQEPKKYQNFHDAQLRAEQARASANAHQPFFNVSGIPPFTRYFMALIFLVHIATYTWMSDADHLQFSYTFGFISGAFTGAYPWEWTALITPLSHALIHGGWMHILVNIVMGTALGILYERTYGTRSTVVFFVLCTLGAALANFIAAPFSTIPIVGASGGISGLFGAFLYLMHYQQGGMFNIPARYGPWPVLILWGLLLSVPAMLLSGDVAWQAHLGGYITGIALIWLKDKKSLPL